MAKYVQPNFDVYGLGRWFNQVQFDTSVFLKGATHISSPTGSTADSPYALLVESLGADVIIKSRQFGDMAWAQTADYDASLLTIRNDIGYVESSVGNLDTLTQSHTTELGVHDVSIGDLKSYNVLQDVSIQANWDRWIDSHRRGFVDNTQTSISFADGTATFTLADTGGIGFQYYKGGIKYDVSGDKTIQLPSGTSAAAGTYYITIEGEDGALSVSAVDTPWSFDPNVVFVATVDWNDSATPKYFLADERHTMLIDYQMHKYLHETTGTQFVSGGELTGPDVSAGDTTVTNANNAVGISVTEIADEDLFLTLPALTRPSGSGSEYVVILRNSGNLDSWKLEGTPSPTIGTYISYDDGTDMVQATPGKYVNTYITFTDWSGTGNPQFAILPGQGQFDTLDEAISENPADFDYTGLPIAEWVVAWQLTWEASTGYTTDGKVALASAPKRINVTSTSSSAPTTTNHNDLLGLQGGTSTQRYHLSLAQYNDYIGKTDVDASLAVVWTELGYVETSLGLIDTNAADIANVETSLGTLNGLINTNTTDITNIETSLGLIDTNAADIANVETSLGTLNGLINTNTTDIGYVETSLGTLNGLINTNITDIGNIETSLGTLDTVNGYQDTSIYNNAVAIANLEAGTIQTWNGLTTSTDNSVGLGGTLDKETDIDTNGFPLSITGGLSVYGTLNVDGSITYINSVDLNVSDNIITVNYGETGDGVTKGYAGLIVDRGSSTNYYFGFSESNDTFRVGTSTEGGLPGDTQAVATRQDTPQSEGIPFWNATAHRFDTVTDFKFNESTGLTISDLITASAGLTLSGLSGDTQTYALMVPATGGGVVSTRALGTNAFSSDAFALVTDVNDVSSRVYTLEPIVTRHTSDIADVSSRVDTNEGAITVLGTDIGDVSSRVYTLEGSATTLASDIADVSSRVDTNETDIAQLDASIIRIDASLNDVIDILDLGFVTETSLGTFKTNYIDPSLNAKLDKAGDTMTGLLTLASQGFVLDGVTITTIDTSTEGVSQLDTAIPTSAAVKSLVDSAISAGVTASNGLTENPAGNIKLGGALSELTTITATDASALKFAGITNVANEQTLYAESSLGKLITTEVGTMAFATASDYETKANLDASLVDVWSELGYVETSLGTLNGLINTNITDIGYVETSLGTLNGLINTNITDITNIESSLGTLNGLINTNTSDITNIESSLGTLDTVNGYQDTSIYNNAVAIANLEAATTDVWNGIELTDSSVGLGGALDYATTITATATNTLSLAGLQTSSADTPLALVQDTAGTAIKVRSLGTMAWEPSANYVPVTGGVFTGDVGFSGNVYFDGSAYFTDVETIDVSSGYIHLNTGLTGAPPPTLQSGIIVGRGSADPYAFVYDENTNTFRIGIAEVSLGQYDDTQTQAVATREDNPTDWGIGFWNENEDRIDTSTGFTFTPGTGLGLPIATNDATATTALMLVGGLVKSRALGSNAFSSDVFATKAYVDGSLSTRDDEITAIEGSITDLSTGKLDAVASAGGTGTTFTLYSGEDANHIAYIKTLKAGAGTTITSVDSSTVEIAVTGAAATVFKKTGSFSVSGTSEDLDVSDVFSEGPFQVQVYEGTEQVYVGVEYEDTSIYLSWTSGALTGTINWIVTG